MTTNFDPGALLAARSMATEPDRTPLPRAPLVPNPLPGTVALRALRHAAGRAMTAVTVATTGSHRKTEQVACLQVKTTR